MGRAIIGGAVVVTLAVLLLVWGIWYRRHRSRREDVVAGRATRGDLSRGQEREMTKVLDDAVRLLAELGQGDPLLGDVDYLTQGSKTARKSVLERYNRLGRGVIHG